MLGFDRIHARFQLETEQRYELPEWAKAEHMENCDDFMHQFVRLVHSIF